MNPIVLIRHAETDLAGKFCGRSDPGLNLAGEGQLPSLVEELAGLEIGHIYSSDLRRASATATEQAPEEPDFRRKSPAPTRAR